MKPVMYVARGRVTDRAEYFRVGNRTLATVRRARATGQLSCLTHRFDTCDHVEAVAKYLQRGRVVRFASRPL